MPSLPNGDPAIPTLMAQIEELKRSVEELRRAQPDSEYEAIRKKIVTFSHAGTPTLTRSPPYAYTLPNGLLTSVSIAATVQATTASIFRVWRMRWFPTAGIYASYHMATITLPANNPYVIEDDIMTDIAELDCLAVETLLVGTGLGNVAITCVIGEEVN